MLFIAHLNIFQISDWINSTVVVSKAWCREQSQLGTILYLMWNTEAKWWTTTQKYACYVSIHLSTKYTAIFLLYPGYLCSVNDHIITDTYNIKGQSLSY